MSDDALRLWLTSELWAVREAAYLLCGQLPRSEAEFIREDRDSGAPVALIYRALKDATIAGSLAFFELDGALMRRRVRPQDVVIWARARQLSIPSPLVPLASNAAPTAAPSHRMEDRQDRRLRRLRELGADRVMQGGKWKTTGRPGALKALCAEERCAKCGPFDEKAIRNDVTEAAERERARNREGRAANPFAGLGG